MVSGKQIVRFLGPPTWLVGLFSVLVLGGASSALAQTTVATLGGGPTDANPTGFSGNADGVTLQQAQFNSPGGMALDLAGGVLYVADTANGSVRRLVLTDGVTGTFVTGLPTPVDVYVDPVTNVFVLTSGDGLIRRYDAFGNLSGIRSGIVNGTALTVPTALVGDSNGNLFVAEAGGGIKKVAVDSGAVSVVPVPAGTIGSARGIALLETGNLAVSDGTKHVVWSIAPSSGAAVVLAGVNGVAGGADGLAGVGRLNAPLHLAQGGGDVLVLADSGNHALRLVGADGTLTRLYGVPPNFWSSNYPGWEDGLATVAEARLPVGVAVDGSGNVFVSEQFYHLIRTATGSGLTGPSGTGGGGGTVTLNPPTLSFSPSSGYFPLGQTITVQSSGTQVYYTTDGTEPTTNSIPVTMIGGTGSIRWKNSTNDLSGLRVASFLVSGTNVVSTNLAGTSVLTNSIGVPPGLNTNLVGGVGSTVLAPVVVNLPPGIQLRRLGFRLEVSANGAAPIVGAAFAAVSVTTNDFIPLVTGDGNATGKTSFTATPYALGTTRGLLINFSDTNANLSVSGHAVVAMIAIPIPGTATEGSTYTIRVIDLVGATDAAGGDVLLNPAPPRTLVVKNVPYLVGDSSPAGWYNAGDFGNSPDGTGAGQLLLSDVNNAFNASVGIRPPYPFTDAFNAMDVFPEDAVGAAGGDGQIRFLDWQIILLRQQHLNTNPVFGISPTNWFRSWSAGGQLTTGTTNLNVSRVATSLSTLALAQDPLPGRIWERQALILAGNAENVLSGEAVTVPVHLKLSSAATVKGLQFRAVVYPEFGGPNLTIPVEFISLMPGERRVNSGASEIAVAWDIGQINLVPGSSNLLGHVRFVVPDAAARGHCYRIRIESADGAPDFVTQYEFETRTGCVWVSGPAVEPFSMASDEWRSTFFSTPGFTGDDQDADGDGFSNLLEYLAGTNPTNAQSLLRLDLSAAVGDSFELLSAPGKRYVLECRDGLEGSGWIAVSTNWGTGRSVQLPFNRGAASSRFYRLRVNP
jgi:hypothetical protein